MVSGLGSDEVESKINETEVRTEKPARSTLIWDAKKKRPRSLLIVALIAITLVFLIYGITDVINSFHEIRIQIDCDDEYSGSIYFADEYESFSRDIGLREFSFTIREGITVHISISRISSAIDLMTIQIYDNGELVLDRTPPQGDRRVDLKYTVGE
jgi:hypothetical protein